MRKIAKIALVGLGILVASCTVDVNQPPMDLSGFEDLINQTICTMNQPPQMENINAIDYYRNGQLMTDNNLYLGDTGSIGVYLTDDVFNLEDTLLMVTINDGEEIQTDYVLTEKTCTSGNLCTAYIKFDVKPETIGQLNIGFYIMDKCNGVSYAYQTGFIVLPTEDSETFI